MELRVRVAHRWVGQLRVQLLQVLPPATVVGMFLGAAFKAAQKGSMTAQDVAQIAQACAHAEDLLQPGQGGIPDEKHR